MLRLITNELIKMSKNKLLPCILVVLLLSSFAYAIVLNNYQEEEFYHEDWVEIYNDQITDLEDQIDNLSEAEEGELIELQAQLESLKYRVENNISPQHWISIVLSRVNTNKITLGSLDDEEAIKELEDEINKMLLIVEENNWREFIAMENDYLDFLLEIEDIPIEVDRVKLMLEENQLRLDYGVEPYFGEDPNNWKNTLLRRIYDNKFRILESKYWFYDMSHFIPYPELQRIEIENKIAEYRIKTDNPPIEAKTFTNFLLKSSDLIILVIIAAIILSSISICNEFSYGTIKRLLIFPYSRWKIITAKHISVALIGVAMVTVMFIASLISGAVIYGIGEINPHIWYFSGEIQETNLFAFVALKYAVSTIEVVVYVIVTMMLAIMFKNAAVTTAIAIMFATVSNRIIPLLYNEYGIGWTKFIVFPNARLTQFLEFNPVLPILTFQFSMWIIILTCIAVLSLTYFCFCNEEVRS